MNKVVAPVMVIAFGIGLFLWSCLQEEKRSPVSPLPEAKVASIRIVTSFYPLAALASGVVGDLGGVTAVVPAGMEPHDYEPSIVDIRSIYDADLFVFNGAGMDAWAEKLVPELGAKGIRSIRLADKVELLSAKEGSGHEHGDEHEEEKVELVGMGSAVEDEYEHEHGEWDPHFWLDPVSAKALVVAMVEALSEKYPEKRASFIANSEAVMSRLDDLDVAYRTNLASCSQNEVVTSHDAFRYLAHRYGFETHALAGISPEEEPSPKRLAEIAAEVKEEGIKYIFFETLVSPKLAETLARETGAETLVFNPIEGITPEESAAGIDYWALMRNNLSALQKALECK